MQRIIFHKHKVEAPKGFIGLDAELVDRAYMQGVDLIRVEGASGFAYEIDISDFYVSCKEKDGELLVPLDMWNKVEGRQKSLM